jgi:ATP-dependent helicase/nuclease subunit A
VRHLEIALERAGVPYVVDGGRSFFDRAEVIETHAVLRAIDDPRDRLSVVAALRSMYFGVSDSEIAAWSLAGRSLDVPTGRDATSFDGAGASPVGRALLVLARFHARRATRSTAALLEELLDETSLVAALHAAAAGSPGRARPRVANLQKIVHLARSARTLGVLTLRGFNRMLSARIEGGGEEPDLPVARPGDPNTVRILTIHRAKGLEAPIVALFDCMDQMRARPDVVPLRDAGRVAIGFLKDCQPPGWDALVLREQSRLEEEAHRLRYVACTRARDWLVVPTPPATEQVGDFWRDIVRGVRAAPEADRVAISTPRFELPEVPIDVADAFAPGATPEGRSEPGLLTMSGRDVDPSDAEPDWSASEWRARRHALMESAASASPAPISVRDDAARVSPPAVIPGPFVGRDFGAFVHRLLELSDLSQPESVRRVSMSLRGSFALSSEAIVRAESQAEAALSLPIVREAARAPNLLRETPIAYVEDDRLLEGVCDLAFRDESGWVVVDYKTESITEDQLPAQAAHHAEQLRRYARGLALASGAHVSRRFVIFTSLGRQIAV